MLSSSRVSSGASKPKNDADGSTTATGSVKAEIAERRNQRETKKRPLHPGKMHGRKNVADAMPRGEGRREARVDASVTRMALIGSMFAGTR